MSDFPPLNPLAQWKALAGEGGAKSRWIDPDAAGMALDALVELEGKPGLLVLDDLSGLATGETKRAWDGHIKSLEEFFHVSVPVLPVHKRHAGKEACPSDDLLPIIQAEIRRLRRPLAAVVDMQWEFCDEKHDPQDKAPWFGLELIRLIKRAKPSLPIFVWSPIQDKQVLQRAMQLGAASCFDKPESLRFNHDLPAGWKPSADNLLDAGKLWFRILEWELARYNCPPVGSSDGDFILATTNEARECRTRFLNAFELTENDLIGKSEPPVERLLRALVPDAVGIEILRFFGAGQSRTERPFVVRGQTATGRWLRPVQIKLSRDWRALAREGKGYRDVFAGCLGPSVAHVLTGPYRFGEWCGMSQSFAAPEEAIRDISSKSTRSLEDWLRKRLSDPQECVQLVEEIFDGVLDPLYKGNLSKRAKSVFKAFDRVSPAHLEIPWERPEPTKRTSAKTVDFTPETLSRKDARSRREMAYRRWREVERWWHGEGDGEWRRITGLVLESLEIDPVNPNESRLRLLDPTLGVKVDIKIDYAGDEAGKKVKAAMAGRWASLARSPIKLVGLPLSFWLKRITSNGGREGPKEPLLSGWIKSVHKLLEGSGIIEGDESQEKPNRSAWERCRQFFHPWHPIDWAEEFHIGPTHGDLNLGNILLHEKGDSVFPWLIDFDKAEDDRPVVFDLAKLEIEANHKIAQELFWELRQLGCVKGDQESRDVLRRFVTALETRRVAGLNHLWEAFRLRSEAVPDSLQKRFEGLFAYLKQVHKRVEDLGIGNREFLIGRAVYAMCCLKFKHLYSAGKHPNAPFPAKVMLWKLEALLEAVDTENGIVALEAGKPDTRSVQAKVVYDIVTQVRTARSGTTHPLMMALSTSLPRDLKALNKLPDYAKDNDWTALLRLLRDKQLPGKNRWMRELLWYVRDFGLSNGADKLAEFTKAMVLASRPTGIKPQFPGTRPNYSDYASTGRPGNTYPSFEMLKHLAEHPDKPLIKISSRGESGGTIDILENAGIPLCRSEESVNTSIRERGWALVETSEALGEVDKILMKLRKECGCMKVDDLAMTSISAKKALLGIPNFHVQIVTGYDAKFHSLLMSDDVTNVTDTWSRVWPAVVSGGKVSVSDFNSDQLASWKNDGVGNDATIVFGQKLLAAKLWSDLTCVQRLALNGKLPAQFCKDMNELSDALRWIRHNASIDATAPATTGGQLDSILSFHQIQPPDHLAKVRCREIKNLADLPAFRDMAAILFQFEGQEIASLLHVPYFDWLYSTIAKSGHPITSIVFEKTWLVLIRPRVDLPADLQSWCWSVLRAGFGNVRLKTP